MPQFVKRGQSYKWPSFVLESPAQDWVGHARIEFRKDGNTTYVDVIPDETAELAAVMSVSYDGVIKESPAATAKSILALISTGSWSGGSCYRGWLVGRVGARVKFSCKGTHRYYHVVENGWVETGPIKENMTVTSI